MKTQAIYKNLAEYYDLLYLWKDYKKEAQILKLLIKKYKKSQGKGLLEVACGSGKHIQHFKKDFSVLEVDINNGILKVAQKNVEGVTFVRGDMTKLKLRHIGKNPC